MQTVRAKPNTTRKIRAAAYCRVSTLLDVQDTSFETQCAVYRKQISENPDYELVGIYGDHGKSGRSMESRPELQRLLADCEAGKIDIILTKSISRFARNMKECVETIQRLKELGVNIFFEREALNSNDSKCELLVNILASIAQEESDSISQNLKWAHDRRCRAGDPIFGKKPYGFLTKGDWVVNEAEARRIRTAFDMADRGCLFSEILQCLNQMETEEQTGWRWTQAKLGTFMKRIVYKGDLLTNMTIPTGKGRVRTRNRGEFDQYYLEGHHEAIVPPIQFDRVQMIMNEQLISGNRKTKTAERLARIKEIHEMFAQMEHEQYAEHEQYTEHERYAKHEQYAEQPVKGEENAR